MERSLYLKPKCTVLENILRNLKLCPVINSHSLLWMKYLVANPEEGISGGYAICERLGQLKNSMNIITTHFNYLTRLTDTNTNEIIRHTRYQYHEMKTVI